MKLKIALNKKSIKNALNALETAKKQLQGEMLNEFYFECFRYFESRAKDYLLSTSIGEQVANEIAFGWKYEKTKNGAIFRNDHEKAVYVEFGVGIVGQENKHTNAQKLGNDYKYNIGSKILPDGSWIFSKTSLDDLDILDRFIINETEHTIRTKGSSAIMYAFNALEDLRLEMPNIWQRIKVKYWG